MIECKNLNVIYQNEILALDDFSVSINGPTVTGIIGPNGAGKSTLLKAILSIVSYSGVVLINGENPKKILKRIAYVEQKTAIDFTFPINVKECVSLGVYPNVGITKRLKKENWDQVSEALKAVRLEEFEQRQINTLSGGQFQRVLLARCLVQKADIILLDEPFVGIDSVSEQIIVQILKLLKENGKTILIVHHDLSKVTQYFDQLLIINKKLISFGQTEEVFTKTNLKEAYGDSIFVEEE